MSKGKRVKVNESADNLKKRILIFLIIATIVALICFFCRDVISNKVNDIIANMQSRAVKEENEDNSDSNNTISLDEALEIAVVEFHKLGEKDLNHADLDILNVNRGGIEYYMVFSDINSIEICVLDGKVTKINEEKIQQTNNE